jgi:subtilisin family serine protease
MSKMKLEPLNLLPGLDPRLQRALHKRRRGLTPRATCSTAAGEIAVAARVSNIEAWRRMTEVRCGTELRCAERDEWLVTARIPVARLGSIRQEPCVRSLKPALRLAPSLGDTVREIGASALPATAQGQLGAGVVVGIVDFDCDFAHANFRRNGKTRLLALWDQTGPTAPDSPFGYGRLIGPSEIDAALASPNPYATLGYDPGAAAHGTHVMDIAAGNGAGTGRPGVAPNADLIFVHLAGTDVPWEGEEVVDSSIGDSVQLLEALRFIFKEAGTRPCVVNVSLGTNGGPHDGTTLVEQAMDELVREQPNRAIVVAASNAYADGIHAAGNAPVGGQIDLRWRVADGDATHNELEVWYDGADTLAVEILAPSGESLGQVALGESARVADEQGKTIMLVVHRHHDPNNGDNVCGVFLEHDAPGGDWTVRLKAVALPQGGGFHAWIERDDESPSLFVPPHDNSHTLGSISCGKETIVVGSYDAHRAEAPISWFSSAGPTRKGDPKPEISAPGQDVWAAGSRTGNKAIRMSGTSMAAPAVTGVVALAFAEARAHKVDLPIDLLRQILEWSARGTTAWDARYGAGRIDARAVVAEVQKLGQTPLRTTRRAEFRPDDQPSP